MADPIVFPSTTANYSLPLLFAGQAQKEPFINHAFSLVDALIQTAVLDSLDTPPSSAADGESYRVLANASGEWSGRDDNIAIRVGGAWEFISPANGMTLFDRNAEVELRFNGGWQSAAEPAAPTGGSTIDSEARAVIESLIEALRTAGLFQSSGPT